MTEYERALILMDGWKQTVAVQMHFNDIEIRIRNMAITVVGALVGVGAFGGAADKVVNPVLLGGVALVAWLAFYFMDRLWYHRLLTGAVIQGSRIEKSLASLAPEIDLTSAISETSPVTIFGWKMHSKQKMDTFYISIAIAIVCATSFVWSAARQDLPTSAVGPQPAEKLSHLERESPSDSSIAIANDLSEPDMQSIALDQVMQEPGAEAQPTTERKD